MIEIRPVSKLAGTRKATRLIASSSRIPISEDCLFSIGTSLMIMFDFLSTPQRTPRFESFLLCLGRV